MIDKEVVVFQIEDMLSNINKENLLSFGGHIDDGAAFLELMTNVLTLLKDQEPRVLNWDEVENYSVVYGEFRGEKEIFPLIITKDTSGRILSWNPGINSSGEYLLLVSDEEDRRNTRCWNKEPTDEQRQAVKWAND